jgi:hypothetical protein
MRPSVPDQFTGSRTLNSPSENAIIAARICRDRASPASSSVVMRSGVKCSGEAPEPFFDVSGLAFAGVLCSMEAPGADEMGYANGIDQRGTKAINARSIG